MTRFETLLYEEENGVARVTLNRPEVHNAFNVQMQRELRDLWRGLRRNDDVRVVILTGAGDQAFCTGIDRTETMSNYGSRREAREDGRVGLHALHLRQSGPERRARSRAISGSP